MTETPWALEIYSRWTELMKFDGDITARDAAVGLGDVFLKRYTRGDDFLTV